MKRIGPAEITMIASILLTSFAITYVALAPPPVVRVEVVEEVFP